MRYLILSDIHANLEALEAVMADAEGLFDSILCLGDLVGYGPDPNAVVAWVREACSVVIRGNHDKAAVWPEVLRYFNPVARTAAEWTHSNLEETHKDYLRNLTIGPAVVDDKFLIVHGSLADEDAYVITVEDAGNHLSHVGHGLIFFGHTHVQGGFFRAQDSQLVKEISASELLQVSDGGAFLINPGSVGQPRDENWKAAYAVYDSQLNQVEYRRCAYDLATTQRKITEAGLPLMLSERLSLGR